MILEAKDSQNFRSLIARQLGLHFGDDKLEFLRDLLLQRAAESRQDSPLGYLLWLEAQPFQGEEWSRLAEALTVTETFFFRNYDHFRALIEIALPERLRSRLASKKLRILSAGCASGEEPYTLAMVLDSHFPEMASWDLKVIAVDLNPAMLAKAAKGLYSSWALRDTPAAARDRYFSAEGKDFRLQERIQRMVSFERRNLAEANLDLWEPGSFDLIFCRNMLMYFGADLASSVVGRMAKALAPEGFLFLGYAETLRGLSQSFHLRHTHDTFYYQLMGRDEARPAPGIGDQKPAVEWQASAPLLWDPGLTWVEAIQGASDRIAGLAARAGKPGPAAGQPRQAAPWSLDLVMELLQRERFAEALQALQSLPPESSLDPDVLLMHAVLRVNLGQLEEAEAACASLLKADELNSGAHYVMALCREHAGDLIGAEEQDRTALYLDAGFAMPWMHLGLLARRSGQAAEARSKLEQALRLLAREDSSRILMFGGGFGREGLAQLCRSGLKSLEVAP